VPIVIKKGAGAGRREPAPLVEDAPKAEVAKEPVQKTPKQTLDWWAEHGMPPNAKPVKCSYCQQLYLKPCAEEQHAGCQNFQFAETRKKRNAEKRTPMSGRR
jgi:hypothetical protein